MSIRTSLSPIARRVGIASAWSVAIIGILYVAVITLWLFSENSPSDPIADPYLAIMEVLTIASALAIVGLVAALSVVAADALEARIAFALGSVAAALTMAVHFVQLTAVRQLWRAGQLPDYRLVWPSSLFAMEYFVWDVLVGLTMLCAGLSFGSMPTGRRARTVLLVGGVLCIIGSSGPISGQMALQNIAVLGYAVVLPIAGALTARIFRSLPKNYVAA